MDIATTKDAYQSHHRRARDEDPTARCASRSSHLEGFARLSQGLKRTSVREEAKHTFHENVFAGAAQEDCAGLGVLALRDEREVAGTRHQ